MFDNNIIKLSGKVKNNYEYSHEYLGERFYNVQLVVCRDSGNEDEIDVVVSETKIDLASDIKDKYVYVTGGIRTRNDKSGERIRVKTFVLADEFNVLDNDNIFDTNDLILHGFICKMSDIRKTPNGRKICDVILAINRSYGKSDYIPCIFWGKLAEQVNELCVGDEIKVGGRFQSREYSKNGKLNKVHEVAIKQFLE